MTNKVAARRNFCRLTPAFGNQAPKSYSGSGIAARTAVASGGRLRRFGARRSDGSPSHNGSGPRASSSDATSGEDGASTRGRLRTIWSAESEAPPGGETVPDLGLRAIGRALRRGRRSPAEGDSDGLEPGRATPPEPPQARLRSRRGKAWGRGAEAGAS
jgi:hypothetical protein